MTHKEMSEIFAVMLLAYPNAEVFKGGIAKLGPTINLWVTCLPEIDFWTGQQAVVKLVRECKFPPTIAEFKEKAEKVQAEVRARIDQAWNYLKLDMDFGKTPEEAVARLSEGTDIRRVIEAMGGPSRLIATGERTFGDGTVKTYEYYSVRTMRRAARLLCKTAYLVLSVRNLQRRDAAARSHVGAHPLQVRKALQIPDEFRGGRLHLQLPFLRRAGRSGL